MKRVIIFAIVTMLVLGASHAFAQTGRTGPGVVEITVIPGGGTFFMEQGREPSFGNYDIGGSVTFNITRFVGIEGEISGALGISQDLQFGALNRSTKTPDLVNYSGNVVVAAPSHSGITPYVSGGVGGLTMMEKSTLGISDTVTFLTGNVGGGLKWYANRWLGLRADYRFLAVQSKDDAPAFFGQERRYGHRVYGGLVINALR